MTTNTNADRARHDVDPIMLERQRIDYLVLGHDRPKASDKLPPKPRDMPKAEWKLRRAELREQRKKLLPGIEERVALRERWSHKRGTPETHEHLDQAQRRPGSLAGRREPPL